MTIHLPEDLERFVHEAVRAGRCTREEDVIRDALEQLRTRTPIATPGLGSIGAMRDDADLLDQVTQDIMESRPSRTLRLSADESGPPRH
jgi:Arc/MetJ-type ribon-helix-helix transcriptional regulator